MHPDWIGVIAFLAACCAAGGYGAFTGSDRNAGRMLMVIGAIVGLLVCVEWCVKP